MPPQGERPVWKKSFLQKTTHGPAPKDSGMRAKEEARRSRLGSLRLSAKNADDAEEEDIPQSLDEPIESLAELYAARFHLDLVKGQRCATK